MTHNEGCRVDKSVSKAKEMSSIEITIFKSGPHKSATICHWNNQLLLYQHLCWNFATTEVNRSTPLFVVATSQAKSKMWQLRTLITTVTKPYNCPLRNTILNMYNCMVATLGVIMHRDMMSTLLHCCMHSWTLVRTYVIYTHPNIYQMYRHSLP